MLMLDAPFRTAGKELGKKREGHTWWVLVAGKRWNAATPAGKPWRGLGLSASATFHIYNFFEIWLHLSYIWGRGRVDGEDIRAINGPYPGQYTVPHKWPKNGTIGPRRHRHQLDRIVRDCCLMSELPAIRF
jgi:hypothetical protein